MSEEIVRALGDEVEHATENDVIANINAGNVALYPNTVAEAASILSFVFKPDWSEYYITKGNISVTMTIPEYEDYDPNNPPTFDIKFRDGSYFRATMLCNFLMPAHITVEEINISKSFFLHNDDDTFTEINLGQVGPIQWKHIILPEQDPLLYIPWPGNELEYGLMFWDNPEVDGKVRDYVIWKTFGQDNQESYDNYWDILTPNLMSDGILSPIQYNENTYALFDYLAGSKDTPADYPGTPTGSGGGGGYQLWPDEDIMGGQLPTINILGLDFIRLYNPSENDVKAMAAWLWSDDFNTNIMKNYTDPFNNIISLAMAPVNISGTSRKLIIGNVESNIWMPEVDSPWDTLDCGERAIDEGYQGFLDYSCNVTIYLPFIGYRSLQIDDVMNGRIWVRYRLDLVTGLVICEVFSKKVNMKTDELRTKVINTYTGNMLYHIPISGANYMSMYNQQLQASVAGNNNFISQAGNALSGIANLASGNPLGAISNALGIMSGSEQQKLIDRQYETAKPEYGRGGSIGGSAGLFSTRYPYLIVSIPVTKVPGHYKELIGQPAESYFKLSDLSGYTEVREARINFKCDDEEAAEILQKLKAGVIL